MSTATLEHKGGSGPALVIPGMEHKAATATATTALAPNSGVLEVDAKQGLVRAIVSVTGIVDNVEDRILPGAYTKTLLKRKPKGVWSHSWSDWVSRTEAIEEYLPGDARLPKQTKDGKPWPKEAGALVVSTKFNMKSTRCREAFLAVEFFSETDECEWCVDDETEVMTGRGWKRYDEISADDVIYALNPKTMAARFEPLVALHVFEDKRRSLRLIETGGFSSLTTAAHRWPIADTQGGHGGVKWATTADLPTSARIFRAAPHVEAPDQAKYDDSFVTAVGWFWTEGWRRTLNGGRTAISIGQSARVNSDHVATITVALERAFPGGFTRRHRDDGMTYFDLTADASAAVLAVTGEDKQPSPEFLRHLTQAQTRALIWTCLEGDGHVTAAGQATFYQVAESGIRAFEMLCALSGVPTNTRVNVDYGNRHGRVPMSVSVLRSALAKPLDAIRVAATQRAGRNIGADRVEHRDEIVEHDGIVWCPQTESTTWLARRRGSVYFTGNSIGYVVPPGQATREAKTGVRNIKSLDLFEYGPVLFGAASESMTLSVKSAFGDTLEVDGAVVPVKVVDPDAPTEEENALYLAAEGEIDWAAIDAASLAAEAQTEDAEVKALLHRRTILGLGGLGSIEAKSTPALADGSFPIVNGGDLTAAVAAYPRAADRVEAKTHIIGRALALGLEGGLPTGWMPESKSSDGKPDVPGGAEELRRYWVSGKGAAKIRWGTDGDFDRCVRLLSKHMGVRAKGWCNLRHQDAVGAPPGKGHAGSKGLQAAYVVEEKTVGDLLDEYDPTVEVQVETKTATGSDPAPVEAKMYGGTSLPGSYEQRQQALREAASEALRGPERINPEGHRRFEWDEITVIATFDDSVIVTRYKWGGGGSNEVESFRLDYTLSDEGFEVTATLGEPEPVTLSTVTVVEGKTFGEPVGVDSFSGLADLVEEVAYGVKVSIATGDVETKAGRVLSGANEARLRAAAEHLFGVLRAAGIQVDTAQPADTPITTPDSTAPSAAPATAGAPLSVKAHPASEGKIRLDPAALAAALRG